MDKNNAKIGIVKKHYEKKITELNREIEALKQKLEEREREFRAQGLKLKDLMSDEFR
jgi:flagellar capping protein FliD